ncbi:HEPN domain-containing protein [Legionella pneumophila serogroup 1]
MKNDDNNLPKITADRFLQDSLLMFYSAQELSKFPLLMRQGSILYHYAIELLLKACDVWENQSYIFSHDLCILLSRVRFIQLSDDDKKLIRVINDYFNYRYPLSEEKFDKMKKTLNENAEEVFDGMLPLPSEIGTDDLEKAAKLINTIVELMPDDLQNIMNRIIENIKHNRLLV